MNSSKTHQLQWLNIFIRDVLLIIVVGVLHYFTRFNSHTVWFITGMMVVWISWQFSDYLNYQRRIT